MIIIMQESEIAIFENNSQVSFHISCKSQNYYVYLQLFTVY